MPKTKQLLSLDVGERRIGVAMADSGIRIAVPYTTIEVDGNERTEIAELCVRNNIDIVVVGYPRNQQGEATAQTDYVEKFSQQLQVFIQVEFQDESLTSVQAKQRLESRRRGYEKKDVDAEAAAIILQDYIEERYGR